jgi:hypothetical protein
VLDVLDELGLAEKTVVVFLSDHGDMMGDHGLLNKGPFHFEGLLRVPMIWRWPGRFRPTSSPVLASLRWQACWTCRPRSSNWPVCQSLRDRSPKR